MAGRSTARELEGELPAVLAEILDIAEEEVAVTRPTGREDGLDILVTAPGVKFAVEILPSDSLGPLFVSMSRVKETRRAHPKAVPVLAVPFMTESGRRVCKKANVSWFDLSGNARIVAPGLRVIIDGRENRFRSPGRPANIFAPKSARVTRWLLETPGRTFTQREIARGTAMTEGFVSRIASRLAYERYVVRAPSAGLRVRDPRVLLEAWRDAYAFDKHTVVPGHVAGRSGDAVTRFVADALDAAAVEHAATGLSAAWQMTQFAAFRTATFFLDAPPSKKLRETIGFREEARGANVWLVVPNDAGVFHGAEVRRGVRCVHAVQAYVDLKGHPERAAEAAERLLPLVLDGEPT